LARRKRKRGHQDPAPAGDTAAQTGVAERPPGVAERRPVSTGESSRAGWPAEPEVSRSEKRNAEVRAGLVPIDSGERPWPIIVSAALAAVVGLGNLIAFAAGLKIGGKHPAAGGVVVFSLLMIACAVGLWRLWYGAVLGFMALLAIIVTVFALLLIEASNLLGLVVALAVVVGAGYLFYKLVRVLSRIQMPRYPSR
jgi:hypothetical protein